MEKFPKEKEEYTADVDLSRGEFDGVRFFMIMNTIFLIVVFILLGIHAYDIYQIRTDVNENTEFLVAPKKQVACQEDCKDSKTQEEFNTCSAVCLKK